LLQITTSVLLILFVKVVWYYAAIDFDTRQVLVDNIFLIWYSDTLRQLTTTGY